MKKLCFFLAVIFIVTISVETGRAVVGYAVAAIVGASAIVAGSSLLIPALVNGPAGKSGWVSLAVGIGSVVSLAAKISMAAIASGSTAIKNMMLQFQGTTLGKTAVQGGVVGYNNISYGSPAGFTMASGGISQGCYASMSAAAASLSGQTAAVFIGSTAIGFCTLYVTPKRYAFYNCTMEPTEAFMPYSESQLGSELSAAVSAGDPAAKNAINAALGELNENMQGNSSSLSPALTNEGRTALNNAVTQAQADYVAGVVPKTPEEIAAEGGAAAAAAAAMYAAMRAALAAQGLSAAEILQAVSAALALNPGLTQAQVQAAMAAALAAAAPALTAAEVQAAVEAALAAKGVTATGIQEAVKAAVDDETGVAEPVETATVLPTKLNLTAVMTSFMSSINALPGLSTLRGLHVTCGGSSTLCMTFLGQQGCYDVAQVPGLAGIGETLFGLISLVSFIGIFRG